MRSLILLTALAVVAVAPLAGAQTSSPSPPVSTTSPSALASIAPSPSSPTFTPSPRATARPWTPRPSPSPATPTAVDPITDEELDDTEDDSAALETPPPFAIPTAAPAAPARPFRTAEREAPPAFVAPQVELPQDADDPQTDPAATETMPPPDQPYVATVTFHAIAATEIDGFELMVIYPRDAGDFVGSRNNVECRKTGDGTMFADDFDDGMLRVLVASNQPLTFPIDIVCRFTVAPNTVLTSRLIAVNVAAVTIGDTPVEASALAVSILAR